MVSDSVRRLVLVVIVMIFASNGLHVSIDAAIDVLAQQQRLQLQRTMLVLNYRQKACEICNAVLLLQSTILYLASLSKKNRDRLVGLKRVVLLQVREVTRDLINARLLYAIHVCVAQERAQKKGLVP